MSSHVPGVSEDFPDLVHFLSEYADLKGFFFFLLNKVQPLCPHITTLIAQLIFCQTLLSSDTAHLYGSEKMGKYKEESSAAGCSYPLSSPLSSPFGSSFSLWIGST